MCLMHNYDVIAGALQCHCVDAGLRFTVVGKMRERCHTLFHPLVGQSTLSYFFGKLKEVKIKQADSFKKNITILKSYQIIWDTFLKILLLSNQIEI